MSQPRPRLRHLASYAAYRGLGEALARAPEGFGSAVTVAVTQFLSQCKRQDRQLAELHLERVLASTSPVVAPDRAVVRRWARRSFRAYGRYWTEGGRLPTTSETEVRSRMIIERGLEHLAAGMATGKGVVMALPHVGSWEWGGSFLASEGFPMTSVAERVEPERLFDWFVDQREAMGLRIVPLDHDASGVVLSTLRSGGLVGLLCDRDIEGSGVEVEFFGERTTFPAGPATMALRTGATLLTAVVYSGPGPFHNGVVSAPLNTERRGRIRDDVVRLTQEIATQFEEYIRRAPEQWHLFQPNWPTEYEGLAGKGPLASRLSPRRTPGAIT